jgi:ATP-dependent Lon protease
MTGEITLRGKVLPVGGVREKVLAAYRAGLKTVLLPKRNMKDLIDVPKRARSEMKIVPVEHVDQVLEIALEPAPPKIRAVRPRRSSRESSGEKAKENTGEARPRPASEPHPLQPGA